MITFSQLNIGDPIYVLEVTGTFKKCTNYFTGSITNISKVYDEPLAPQQFPMPNQIRRKMVDITISCGGESKKLAVEEGKTIITDNQIGLTVATDKQSITNMVKATYNDYKAKKEALAKYEEEMSKCEDILKKLDYVEEPKKENDTVIQDMQQQIKELKDVIKQLTNTEQKTDQQIQSEKVS